MTEEEEEEEEEEEGLIRASRLQGGTRRPMLRLLCHGFPLFSLCAFESFCLPPLQFSSPDFAHLDGTLRALEGALWVGARGFASPCEARAGVTGGGAWWDLRPRLGGGCRGRLPKEESAAAEGLGAVRGSSAPGASSPSSPASSGAESPAFAAFEAAPPRRLAARDVTGLSPPSSA